MKKTVVILSAIMLLLGCSAQTGKKPETGKPAVKIFEAKKGDIIEKLAEVGKLQPLSSVKVKSNVTGSIKKLNFLEGDSVKIGQSLAVVQPGREAEQYQSSEILAPATGVVIERNVEEGDMVTSGLSEYSGGSVMATIANLSKMVVDIDINEVDIAKVKVHLPAIVKIEAFKRKEYPGKVTKISPMARLSADGKINIFTTEVEIIGNVPELRPGMKAVVEIKLDERKNVTVLPVESVFEEENEQVVYAVKDGKNERLKVKVGLYDDNNIEIMEGVAVGDKVLGTRPEGFENLNKDLKKSDYNARRVKTGIGL